MSGALDVCCRHGVSKRYGALELWRCPVGVLPLRGMETGCSRADVETWSLEALEVRCRRCVKRGMELWSCGGVVQVEGRVGVCLERSGDASQACRCGGAEV